MSIFVSLFGLLIGSFLNVCIYRLPREESIAFPASHCPNCNERLKTYNLKGKCSYCGEKISPQYPLVEGLNMLLYLGLYGKFGLGLDFFFYASISSLLLVVAFIDLNEMLIYDKLLVGLIGLSILEKFTNYMVYGKTMDIKSSILGAVLGGGLFLLIYLLSKGGMGDGDITLMASIGFILGWKHSLLTMILSFILGAIISVFLLAFKIKDRSDPIPFGPFIISSFFIVVFYGEHIITWYIGNFL